MSTTSVFALEFVEQRGRGLFDPLPQRRNGSRGEHRRHQLAVPGVSGRFDRQQRWCPKRVQQSGVGLVGDPGQRFGQIAALLRYAEIVRAQQLVGDTVVDGHQHGSAADQRALVAQLVREGCRVLPDGGISDRVAPVDRRCEGRTSRGRGRHRAGQTTGFVASFRRAYDRRLCCTSVKQWRFCRGRTPASLHRSTSPRPGNCGRPQQLWRAPYRPAGSGRVRRIRATR